MKHCGFVLCKKLSVLSGFSLQVGTVWPSVFNSDLKQCGIMQLPLFTSASCVKSFLTSVCLLELCVIRTVPSFLSLFGLSWDEALRLRSLKQSNMSCRASVCCWLSGLHFCS